MHTDKMIGVCLSDRYLIVEKIGAGGMSNVYKAKCNVLNRFVAIKILKEEFRGQEEFLRRFKTESQAVALLSHPNIVSIYDVGTHEGLPYIVMELIEGITLKEYIRQKGQLSWREVVLFTSQILKALEHAHSRKIIHRDIKPQNIMILRDGTIKVADFGIARFTMSNTQTITESAVGSAHYLSPEQAKGSVTDEKSDIYAVGVVMYEMITGQVPFDAESPVSVAIMHLRGNPVPPSRLRKDILPGLESITMKAMARESFKRYESASAMLRDIEALRKNPNIQFEFKYTYNPSQNTQYFGDVAKEHEAQNAARSGQQPPARRPAQGERNGSIKQKSGIKHPKYSNRTIAIMLSAIVVGLVILFFLVTNGVRLFNNLLNTGNVMGEPAEQVEVPDLRGKVYEDVINDEAYSDFQIVVSERVNDNEIEEGRIINQNPGAKMNVKPGSTISVTVSQGKKMVTIPPLTNKEYRSATLELQGMGLRVKKEEQFDDTVIEGSVIRSDPEEGTEVAENTEVTIVVSLGKEIKQITMINVVGTQVEEARQNLLAAGFTIQEVKSVESSKPKGEVVFQSIAEGAVVDEKTAVTLEISAGQTVEKSIPITLPSSPAEFVVSVMVNGIEKYHKVHYATEEQIYVPISGMGSCLVEITIDGQPYSSQVMDFS